jgi:hypothetical protein
MNYMLKWQESNMDVFSAAALLDMQDHNRHLNHYLTTGLTRVAGIDVGKNNDPTVITINEMDFENPIVLRDPTNGDEHEFHRGKFVAFLELEGRFEDHHGEKGQYSRACEFLREWDVVRATIDATSIGDPVAERMQKLTPEIEWEFFKFSSPTKHNLYKHYIDEVESGRQTIAASEPSRKTMFFQKWEEEHRNLEKHTTNNGYMDCRAPKLESRSAKEVEAEEEYHDDYPTASALASWAGRSATLAEVEMAGVAASSGGGYSSGGRYGGRSTRAQRYGRR